MEQERFRDRMRAAAREARREPTVAEAALWELVRNHRCGGLGFRRQVIKGPFRLDFYCPAARLAVEVDGSVHDDLDVQRRDADRQTLLEKDFGIQFVRLTNEDVLRRPQQTLQRIRQAAQPTATGPSPRSGEGCPKGGVGS